MRFITRTRFVAVALAALCSPLAQAVSVSFTQLTGTLGGTPAATAVFRSDLSASGLAQIQSITIQDNSAGTGGASGQFSGFDLDAVILSPTLCATAACVAGAPRLAVFDYSPAGTFFTPGSQRPPAAPKLFGTDATGTQVDKLVATLSVFDGNSTTAIPGADGFVSLGDGGKLAFNLTALVTTTDMYLYIGEVGNNGEVAAGTISVSDKPVAVPEPGMLALMGLGLGLVGFRQLRRSRV